MPFLSASSTPASAASLKILSLSLASPKAREKVYCWARAPPVVPCACGKKKGGEEEKEWGRGGLLGESRVLNHPVGKKRRNKTRTVGAVEMRVRSSTTVMVEGSPRPRSSVFSGRTRT